MIFRVKRCNILAAMQALGVCIFALALGHCAVMYIAIRQPTVPVLLSYVCMYVTLENLHVSIFYTCI